MIFAATLALLFILKILYPKGKPLSQIITKKYGRATLQTFRKLEKCNLKIEKQKCHIEFLTLCEEYKVAPKFLQFRVSTTNFHTTQDYKAVQLRILRTQLHQYKKKLRDLQFEFDKLSAVFYSTVSYLDYYCFTARIARNVERLVKVKKCIQSKKLLTLGIDVNSKHNPEDVIVNLTDISLTKQEKEVLTLGLDFCIPKKINYIKHFLAFEKLIHKIKQFSPSITPMNQVINGISTIAHNSYNEISKLKTEFNSVFPSSAISVLKNLKERSSIIITKPDKGNGVVIMEKNSYINKVMELLQDHTKFKKIEEDVYSYILLLEEKLNRVLRKLKGKLNGDVYEYLFARGSSPGILYGLPKIHKVGAPIRPIISCVKTFNYNLAKYLVPFIVQVSKNEYTVENSHAFAEDVKKMKFEDNVFMASLDVKSLFTNVPVKETIEIVLSKLFENVNYFQEFTRKEFKQLLELASSESVFMFNDNLYRQLDGLSMGLPLAPCMANAFLSAHEINWLHDCPDSFKPLFYRRYVDDTFAIFNSEENANRFVNYLNGKHPNMQFTLEKEDQNRISFLDILVTKSEGSFQTTVYRKPTYTGVGLHYFSFTDKLFKINVIKTLLERAFKICSGYNDLHEELMKLKDYFKRNGYPIGLIENMIKKFMDRSYERNTTVATVNKMVKYIKLPYYGTSSFKIRKELKSLLENSFGYINFKIT